MSDGSATEFRKLKKERGQPANANSKKRLFLMNAFVLRLDPMN